MNATTPTDRRAMATEPAAARAVIADGVKCDHCDERALYFTLDGLTTRFFCREGYLAHIRSR